MSYEREVIDVRVSRRILWVGGEAYPLQNIARAQTIELLPDHRPALRRYIMMLALCGILAAIVPATRINPKVAAVVLVGLVVISTITFFVMLPRRTFYELVIETAGTPRTALVSTDQRIVSQLVHAIMDAIDNPVADFQIKVENVHIGNKIHVRAGRDAYVAGRDQNVSNY